MIKCFISSLFFFVLLGSKAQTAPELVKEADKKYKNGNHKSALDLYTQAINISKDSGSYYYSRSEVYFALAKLEDSFADICQAIKLSPKNPIYYMQRGYIYYLLKKAEKSVLDYSMAAELATSDSVKVFALVNRSSSRLLHRDFKGCEMDCKEVLSIDSMSIGALNNLAMCLDDLGRGNESMIYLKKIVEIDSTATFAFMNMGFKLSQEEKYKEALIYYDKAINQGFKEGTAFNNRGYTRLKLGDLKGADEDIRKSIKLNPNNSYAYRNLGHLNIAQGDKSKACKNWEMAIALGFTKLYGKEVQELLKKYCL